MVDHHGRPDGTRDEIRNLLEQHKQLAAMTGFK
jgi:hypothetical protein